MTTRRSNDIVAWHIQTNKWTFDYIKKVDEILRKRNKRHIYNVNDYLMIQKKKPRLIQCFAYTHKRKSYNFLIVNIVERCLNSKNDHKWLMNSILNLSVYKITKKQRIYFIFYFFHNIVYFIEVSNESDWQSKKTKYLLHCTWNVNYL